MYNAIALSNYVVLSFEKRGTPITNLKLQKILYYIQGYFMKALDREAFCDDIHCWHYGPVVPIAYYEYHLYGSRPLKSTNSVKINLDREERKLIDKIIEKCESIPSSKLVSMTHEELPWKSVNIGETIEKTVIKRFFSYNDPLGLKI